MPDTDNPASTDGAGPAPTGSVNGGTTGRIFIVVTVVVAVVIATVWFLRGDRTEPGTQVSDPRARVAVGAPAPQFSGRTTKDEDFSLTDLKGRPVWLVFQASWCGPCRSEAPDIEAMRKRHTGPQDLAIVGIHVSEDARTANDYAERVGIGYQLLPDPTSQLANVYGASGIPTHVFINRDGTVRRVVVGALGPSQMQSAVKEITGSR